jgi:hypothetical protein|tara:strand:- start:204 stop:455 length:252 start_codon:yes stop_codon:yes gene_type:complete
MLLEVFCFIFQYKRQTSNQSYQCIWWGGIAPVTPVLNKTLVQWQQHQPDFSSFYCCNLWGGFFYQKYFLMDLILLAPLKFGID